MQHHHHQHQHHQHHYVFMAIVAPPQAYPRYNTGFTHLGQSRLPVQFASQALIVLWEGEMGAFGSTSSVSARLLAQVRSNKNVLQEA